MSGRMASTGHASAQAPGSMQVPGSTQSILAVAAPCRSTKMHQTITATQAGLVGALGEETSLYVCYNEYSDST